MGTWSKNSANDPPPLDTCRPHGQRKEAAVTIGTFRGWELLDNFHDPVLAAKKRKENDALNKAIDDLDMMFLPSVSGTGKQSGRNFAR
jgi:hypothetical protein